MKRNKKQLIYRSLTAGLVAGLLGIATPAQALAAPTSGALPDATRPVSLVIDRVYPGPTGGSVGDGTYQVAPGRALPGATFRVQQVNQVNSQPIDLTTSSGWQVASALSREVVPEQLAATAGVQLGEYTTGVTSADGRVRFDELGMGLFLVKEVATPAGHYPAIPFLVTLPMTHPDGTSWMYEVFAQPKAGTTPQPAITGELTATGTNLHALAFAVPLVGLASVLVFANRKDKSIVEKTGVK